MHLPALSKNATILWLLSYTVTTCNGYGVTWRSGLAMTRAHGLGLVGGDTRVVSGVTMWLSDYLVGCGMVLGLIGWLSEVVAWIIFVFTRADGGSGCLLLCVCVPFF